MKSIVIILFMIIAGLVSCIFYQRYCSKQLLRRMEKMISDARNGCFQPENIDEGMISSMENTMKLFLQDSLIGEENIQIQKDKIQTLISDISHQTITPLSNIVIYSQLLEEELSESPYCQKAQIVRKQAEKLDFLLQSLVKTSRLETGVIKTVRQQCELASLMRSVIAQGEQKAEGKKIRIIFDRTQDEILAMCDPRWTKEACFNILDNAIKYTGSGGTVEVTVTKSQMFARIDIRDNGRGMDEEDIPKIFGRFCRGSDAGGEEGVGLGLYLAREIVQSCGGYIKVASKKGVGTCFSIFLPEGQNISEV